MIFGKRISLKGFFSFFFLFFFVVVVNLDNQIYLEIKSGKKYP